MSQIVYCENCGAESDVTELVFDSLRSNAEVTLKLMGGRVRCCENPRLKWGLASEVELSKQRLHVRLLTRKVAKWEPGEAKYLG